MRSHIKWVAKMIRRLSYVTIGSAGFQYVVRDRAFSAHTDFQPILWGSTEGDLICVGWRVARTPVLSRKETSNSTSIFELTRPAQTN